MAKITDPDLLTQNVEVKFDSTNKQIQLIVSGNLSNAGSSATNGLSFQTLYSFAKEEWRVDSELIKFPFPILSITPNQFEIQEDWDFSGSATRDLVRDGGYALRAAAGNIEEEYMNITTLGTFDAGTDLAYYQQSASLAKTDFVFSGEVNELVKIWGDATHGSFDYRNFFKAFLRVQAKVFSFGNLLVDQLLSTLTFQKFALPLTNSSDVKITNNDSTITGSAPYTGISTYYQSGSGFGNWVVSTAFSSGSVVQATSSVRWFYTVAGGTSTGNDSDLAGGSDSNITWVAYTGERLIGTTYYAYNIFIEGNAATAEQIYEKTQFSLRTGSDIDTGDALRPGNVQDELLNFIGDTLRTTDGVYIDNFISADTNRLEFTDVSGTVRTFPFVAAGTINFNANLQSDPSASFWMFFTTASTNLYGSTNAILVDDNSGIDISGSIDGLSSVSYDFDYDNNTQGGRASGSDAFITVVAIGLSTAQFVSAESTIARSVSNSLTLVSSLERNYLNP